MVDENLRARLRHEFLARRADALGVVEIGADNQVRRGDKSITSLAVLLIDEDFLRSWHPVVERGKLVGNDDMR